jgi:hypothetical protein
MEPEAILQGGSEDVTSGFKFQKQNAYLAAFFTFFAECFATCFALATFAVFAAFAVEAAGVAAIAEAPITIESAAAPNAKVFPKLRPKLRIVHSFISGISPFGVIRGALIAWQLR